jgi:hypothetical protein
LFVRILKEDQMRRLRSSKASAGLEIHDDMAIRGEDDRRLHVTASAEFGNPERVSDLQGLTRHDPHRRLIHLVGISRRRCEIDLVFSHLRPCVDSKSLFPYIAFLHNDVAESVPSPHAKYTQVRRLFDPSVHCNATLKKH